MKTRIFTSVLMIFFIGCNVSIEESIIVDGKVIEIGEYVSNEHQFSINYPLNWVLISPQDDILFAAKDPQDGELNVIDITLLSDEATSSNSFNDLVEGDLKMMNSFFSNFKIIDRSSVKIDGYDSHMIECTFIAEGFSMESNLHYIEIGDKVYNLGVSSSVEDFDKYQILFTSIIERIQLK